MEVFRIDVYLINTIPAGGGGALELRYVILFMHK